MLEMTRGQQQEVEAKSFLNRWLRTQRESGAGFRGPAADLQQEPQSHWWEEFSSPPHGPVCSCWAATGGHPRVQASGTAQSTTCGPSMFLQAQTKARLPSSERGNAD